jgi:hypothetical protein
VRTTLSVDHDLLVIVKEIAAQRNQSMGEVVSELLRKALAPAPAMAKVRNGVPLLTPPAGAARPTLELVNRLRDE